MSRSESPSQKPGRRRRQKQAALAKERKKQRRSEETPVNDRDTGSNTVSATKRKPKKKKKSVEGGASSRSSNRQRKAEQSHQRRERTYRSDHDHRSTEHDDSRSDGQDSATTSRRNRDAHEKSRPRRDRSSRFHPSEGKRNGKRSDRVNAGEHRRSSKPSEEQAKRRGRNENDERSSTGSRARSTEAPNRVQERRVEKTDTAAKPQRSHTDSVGVETDSDAVTFEDLGVPAELASVLSETGRRHPFAIQTATIVDSLAGRDICGRAPTGSGKTLAFAIPAVIHAEHAAPHHPTVLILTPTRELAAQIRDEIAPLARPYRTSVATFYGGTKVGKDVRRLSKGVDIAVATPGRLEDLMGQGEITLAHVGLVIVDEADRMADMGFLPVVKKILDQTPEDRQTLLFSATLDGDVDVLITRYQNDPARHEVDVPAQAKGDVSHHFWATDPTERRPVTNRVLERSGQTIVFTRTKRGADRLAKNLKNDGFTAAAIHGDRTQKQREKALAQFGNGKIQALVATDVAARGIHVDGVDAVLHFDVAGNDKDYIHRSGRTGRAGADGTVITLVRPTDTKATKALLRALAFSTSIGKPDPDVLP